jgi:hypothetical protein
MKAMLKVTIEGLILETVGKLIKLLVWIAKSRPKARKLMENARFGNLA